MATTMALPDFRFVRLREHFGLESGVDHILDVELIPAGAQVGMQSFTANVFSLEEDYVFSTSTVRQTAGLSVQNYGYVYFTCWYTAFVSSWCVLSQMCPHLRAPHLHTLGSLLALTSMLYPLEIAIQ